VPGFSALTRRRARQARLLDDTNEAEDSVCPSGLTACLVKGGDTGSFEVGFGDIG
jgi:hypothetical protein